MQAAVGSCLLSVFANRTDRPALSGALLVSSSRCLQVQAWPVCSVDFWQAVLVLASARQAARHDVPARVNACRCAALAAAGVGFWCHNRHTTPTHGPRTLDKRRTASPHGLLGGDLDVERGSRGPNTDPDGSGG